MPICPRCAKELTFVMHQPSEEPSRSGDKIIVPLDSDIYRCPDHGNFRVYISGDMKPYPG